MDPEAYGDSDMKSDAPMGMSEAMMGMNEARQRRNRTISHDRRVELAHLAERMAMDVLERTKPHERCLLRRMVENLMPGED